MGTPDEDYYRGRQRPSRTSAAFTKYEQEAGSLFGSGLLTLVAGAGFEPATSSKRASHRARLAAPGGRGSAEPGADAAEAAPQAPP
jgi:hypothetical protein